MGKEQLPLTPRADTEIIQLLIKKEDSVHIGSVEENKHD